MEQWSKDIKPKGTWEHPMDAKDKAIDNTLQGTKEGLEGGSQTLHGLAKKVDEKQKEKKKF